MKSCPCGSDLRYMDCCGRYHTKKENAPTPLSLMRSRFSAYCENKLDYIQRTMKPPALLRFNKKEAKKNPNAWFTLEIVHTQFDPNNPDIGFVEFKAFYREKDKILCLHENSEFHLIDGKWYYVDGEQYN